MEKTTPSRSPTPTPTPTASTSTSRSVSPVESERPQAPAPTASTSVSGSAGKSEKSQTLTPTASVSPDESEKPQQQRPRRSRWFALAVPAAIVLITASSHHISPHDFSADDSGLPVLPIPIPALPLPAPISLPNEAHSPWHHKRQDLSSSSSSGIVFPTGASSTSSGTADSTATSSLEPFQQALPTIPASPPTPPSPFPEPLDTVSQGFSTEGCQSFIEGLAQSSALQACVPFSLLLQSSNSFISTQNNLTALNAVIYASCNPQPSLAQCCSTILQLAASLQTACKTDLADSVAEAQSTLTALLAYAPMQQAACQTSPTTNAYCYTTAVHSTNPSDLYFFQLPLGVGLPNDTTPSCSGCTKSVMARYAESAAAKNVSALSATYPEAARVATSKCGSGYAEQISTISQSSATSHVPSARVLLLSGLLAGAAVLAAYL